MDPNTVAHALKWALDRYPLTVTARQTVPVTWTCQTCWASTDVAPASIVAFPHKPGCQYHEAVKAYVAVAREADWQSIGELADPRPPLPSAQKVEVT